jgi:uncharacterized membrane protein
MDRICCDRRLHRRVRGQCVFVREGEVRMKNNAILIAILSLLLGAIVGLVAGLWIGFSWGYNTGADVKSTLKEMNEMVESIEQP